MRGKVILFSVLRVDAGKRNEISFRWNGRKDHPRICGKSSQLRRWPGVMRDHPRICGEKSALTNCLLFPLGSPPHMRGKAFLPTPAMVLSRITPAYAGKSYRERYGHHQGRDHPRICGEKSTRKRRTDSTLGSPPHMRGKVLSFVFRLNRDGITPAYAGKSHYPVLIPEERRDHPRICGEKPDAIQASTAALGSPPHMRGKATQRR